MIEESANISEDVGGIITFSLNCMLLPFFLVPGSRLPLICPLYTLSLLRVSRETISLSLH